MADQPPKRLTRVFLTDTSSRAIVDLETKATHTIRIGKTRPIVVGVLRGEDAFHAGGVVALPAVKSGASALPLVAAAIEHGALRPGRLLVAAHGAGATGPGRAESLRAVLRGDRDAFAAVALEKGAVQDWQRILTWLTSARGYDCDPLGVDDETGPNTKAALRRFREQRAARGLGALPGGDAPTAADWAAFLDEYLAVVARTLAVDAAGLASMQAALQPTTRPAVACEAHWPAAAIRMDGHPGGPADRVDLLLVEAQHAPETPCHPRDGPCAPNQCDVYRKKRYTAVELRPRRKRVQLVDLEDVGFHFDSAVLMPDARVGEDEAPHPDRVTGLAAIQVVLRHARRSPTKRLLVAGHTDTAGSADYNVGLSKKRAANVLHYLRGEREAWAASCQAQHKTEDWQQVLAWVAATFGWDTDPGPERGTSNEASRQALARFRERARTERGLPLPAQGAVTPADWGAFYDLYDDELGRRLRVDLAGLASFRADLRFLATPSVGCGEHWPLEAVGVDGFRSPTNRRVELLFFEEVQAPALACHQGGACQPKRCDLYAPGCYEPEYLPPSLGESPPPRAGWSVPGAPIEPTVVDLPGSTAGWDAQGGAVTPTVVDLPGSTAGWDAQGGQVTPTVVDLPGSTAGWRPSASTVVLVAVDHPSSGATWSAAPAPFTPFTQDLAESAPEPEPPAPGPRVTPVPPELIAV